LPSNQNEKLDPKRLKAHLACAQEACLLNFCILNA
jgi:hypothetical protein